MRKLLKTSVLLFLVISFSGFMKGDSDFYFEMAKGIDIFGRVYKELSVNYVDEIKPKGFMLEGIKGMLAALDPYTVYIDEDHQKDIDLITRGKYGGIGATVGLYNDKITVVDLIEGYSAQRQGIRIGDVIKKVDSVEVNKNNYEKLGNYLKKEPGTEIRIVIEREGEPIDLVFNLVSEEIEIKNLTYYGFVPENSNNAYLKLSGFSRSAGDEIRKALHELRIQKDINSIVLDLRGNPGGLLDAAIDVSEKFLQKGDLVVSIIGRDTTKKQIYKAKEKPIAQNAKLALLVNYGSASASEIVAGAMQDHDRGIILGTKSFGKGLVQTVVPLSFNTSLKLTTAKYYTPSGRCIQEIDYSKNKDIFYDSDVDTTKIYFTDNKRKVFASGGITPDTLVKNISESQLVRSLLARGMFFKFATHHYNTNLVNDLNKIDDDKIFNEFLDYLENSDFSYKTKSENLLNQLKKTIELEGYNHNLLGELNQISEKFEILKKEELKKYRADILSELKSEIAARVNGRKGRILESLKHDKQFETAFSILNNTSTYNKLLGL